MKAKMTNLENTKILKKKLNYSNWKRWLAILRWWLCTTLSDQVKEKL